MTLHYNGPDLNCLSLAEPDYIIMMLEGAVPLTDDQQQIFKRGLLGETPVDVENARGVLYPKMREWRALMQEKWAKDAPERAKRHQFSDDRPD